MTLSNGLPQKEFNDLLGNVREFRDEIVTPNVIDWERTRTFPSDAISSASNLGLLGMEIPLEMGGLGLSFSQKLKVLDTFSEVSMPYAFSLVNSHNVAARLARHGSANQRERYLSDLISGKKLGSTALTEPSAGSDFSAISAHATPVDGGWNLTGEKAWITNAAASNVIVAYIPVSYTHLTLPTKA